MDPQLSAGAIIVRLLIVVALVLANGFFVAAEFALVAARKTRIDAMVEEGNRRARIAREALVHLDRYISGTQLGITLASLGLGWVGEGTISTVLIQWFSNVPEPWRVLAAHGVAVPIAFFIITFLHIVIGELAPKSLALLHPERVSLWTAGPLVIFSRLLSPLIVFLNGSAHLLLRLVGLRAPTELERIHRPDEIEMLLMQTYEHGLLAEEPVEMIRGVFDLAERLTGAAMAPRTEVVPTPDDATVQEATALILEHGHTRIPVFRESLDQIVGVILAREVWRAEHAGEEGIAGLIHPILFVPDSKDLEALLVEMQRQFSHIAVVVDEFGGTAGIITLEDIVEEIVGDIRDEYETAPPEIEETPTGEIILSGGVPVFELNGEFGLKLPEAGYATVAGYVLGRLGRIARVGDEVIFPGGNFRVLEMDGRRIDRLALTLTKPHPDAGLGE
jgi:CBS domain containing-hemolysin-like protein